MRSSRISHSLNRFAMQSYCQIFVREERGGGGETVAREHLTIKILVWLWNMWLSLLRSGATILDPLWCSNNKPAETIACTNKLSDLMKRSQQHHRGNYVVSHGMLYKNSNYLCLFFIAAIWHLGPTIVVVSLILYAVILWEQQTLELELYSVSTKSSLKFLLLFQP